MLRPFQLLQGRALNASDGKIGNVREFYFDDKSWKVRYLVVDTGFWLRKRQVLVVPELLGNVDAQNGAIEVRLNKNEVRKLPPLDSDKPVSRQYEEELRRHYAWTPYRSMVAAAGWGTIAPPRISEAPSARLDGDSQLRSSSEVLNRYSLCAEDGEVGRVHDFFMNEHDWSVPYAIVRTGVCGLGKDVLMRTDFVGRISFRKREISVSLLRCQIKEAPACAPAATISRELEQRLDDHYGRPRTTGIRG